MVLEHAFSLQKSKREKRKDFPSFLPASKKTQRSSRSDVKMSIFCYSCSVMFKRISQWRNYMQTKDGLHQQQKGVRRSK